MKLSKTCLCILFLLAACKNEKNSNGHYIEINSAEYNLRLVKEQVRSQKVFAIVESNSEIKPLDSILLLAVSYLNNVERARFCYSYSPSNPQFDEYPTSTLGYHDVFEIPFDYKSLCFKSKYSFDSLGRLRAQIDSVDGQRINEYRYRSGMVGKDVLQLGDENKLLSIKSKKYFDKAGKDSLIKEFHLYTDGGFILYKRYEWLNDSTFKIRSTLVNDTNKIKEAEENLHDIKGELVFYKMTSKDSRVNHIENYLPPMVNFKILHSNYPTSPDLLEKNYKLEANRYVSIYFNKAWITSGYYDSTIIECNNEDSIIYQAKFSNERYNVNVPTAEFKLASSITYNRNNRGLLTSKIEDNHILGGSQRTDYRYEFENGRIIKKEEISEWFNDKGQSEGTTTTTITYDQSGNILELVEKNSSYDNNRVAEETTTHKIIYSYDVMGNKTSEKVFSDGKMELSKEWKFNNKGLITEYLFSDKKNGRNQKLVWVYQYK